MLSVLLPRMSSVIACQSKRKGALEQDEIVRIAKSISPSLDAPTSESVASALQTAKQRAAKGDVVLVAGSLFVVGEARSVLINK
jgi:folylpolyglutamate synthase/dihydropteroate synthase